MAEYTKQGDSFGFGVWGFWVYGLGLDQGLGIEA